MFARIVLHLNSRAPSCLRGLQVTPALLLLLAFLFVGAPSAHGAITRINSCAVAGSSCTIAGNSNAVGDLFIAYAYRSGSTTAPTLPTGWTSINSSGANSNSELIACKVATTASETSGTWTNATDLIIVWYRGTAALTTANCNTTGIGGQSGATASSNSISYNGITTKVTNGTSWIMGCAGHTTANNVGTAPAGMTNVTSVGAGPMAACQDTNQGASSWGTQSVSVSATSGWESYVLELLAPCVGICADVFVDMNTSTPGTVLTPAILTAGTIGTIGHWDVSNSPLSTMTVGPHQIARHSPVTVNNTVYTTDHPSQSIAQNNSTAFRYTHLYLPSGHRAVTTSGFITFAPPNNGPSSQLFDYVVIYSVPGHYACLQLNNGKGTNPGIYAVNVETDGAGTTHSSDIPITPGGTYWFTLKADYTGGLASLALYETTGWTQVGATVTAPMITGADVSDIRYGNNEDGVAATTSYFENILVDYTYGVFPLGPGPGSGSGIALQGTVTDRTSGRPLSGVKIFGCNGGPSCNALTTTDANGNYWVTTQQINSQTSGTLWFQGAGYYVNPVPFTITTSPTTLNANLLAGGTVLQGTLKDANTLAGIDGATLQLSLPNLVFGNIASVSSTTGGQYQFDSSNFYEAAATGFTIANDGTTYLTVTANAYSTYQAPGFQATPPYPNTQNILLNPTGLTRNITVNSTPANLSLIVDGTTYTLPQTFTWVPGNEHTIAAVSPQTVSPGTQSSFLSWSNGGPISQTIVVPNLDTTYTASFATQYLLTTAVSPANGGSITAGGWFNAGSSVPITATANSGYQFSGFAGNLSGSTNPQTLILNAPSSVTANFVVTVIPTTTTLSSSANPSTPGQTVTLTATVSPSAATGSVTFKDGSATLATVALTGNQAVFSTSTLTVGTHSLTAVYSGDSTYSGSTSAILQQGVALLATSTALTSSANPSTPGQTVTLTATVSPSAATGSVTFKDGAATLATVALTGNQAVFSTSTLTVGTHSLTAVYSGDSTYSGSTSSILQQGVALLATSTVLSSSVNPSSVGQSITLTATVSPSAATGTVTFQDGSTTLATIALTGNQASFSTSALTAGTHSLSATYSGDSTYAGSVSPTVQQGVSLVGTTTALSSSANPSNLGQSVTLTATVSAAAATGSVTFKDGAVTLATIALSGNQASFSTSTLTVGTHSLTATYSGDSTYAGSTSPIVQQGVVQGAVATTTTLTSSPNPSNFGQSVTLTAVVTATTPTGTVTFNDGSTTLAVVALTGNQAVYPTSTLSIGNHSLTATYSGDGTYTGSTSAPVQQGVVSAGVALFGTVTDRTSQLPIANASVKLCVPANTLQTGGSCTQLTTTGTDGSYSLNGTQVGSSDGALLFQMQNYYGNLQPFTGGLASLSEVDATLLAGGIMLQGTVTDSNTGDGIVGATVSFYPDSPLISADGGNAITAVSGTMGKYSLDSSHFLEAAVSNFTMDSNASYATISAPGYLSYPMPGFTAVAPYPLTENYTLVPNGASNPITVTTTPAGLAITVDGLNYVSPRNFLWPTGSIHFLAVGTPQGGSNTQYLFNQWSDLGAAMHPVTIATGALTYTAAFDTQYLLATSVLPANSGSITAGGWFAAGTPVSISATPNAGYQFNAFSGGLSGAANPQTLVMNSPATVTANFVSTNQAPGITSAATTTFTVGKLGSFTVTATGLPTPTMSESGALPTGVSFNASTGTLSGTPAAATPATYPITFTASNGVSPNAVQGFSLVVSLPVAASLTLNPTSVSGGVSNSTGTVTLNAPAAGTTTQRTVTLSSSNTTAATVPASVTVSTGATSANFTVTSHAVTAISTANITATSNGGSQFAVLTVVPPPAVTTLTLNPTSVLGGSANSTGTVTLNAPAAGSSTARTVTLSSSNTAAATVPNSVTVASGATTATFTVTSHTVLTAASATISAKLNGTATAALTVNPVSVASVTLNPTSVPGGATNSTGTVKLTAPATGTSAQRTVTLSSDNTAAATVPASVTVSNGATSATFTVTSHAVAAAAMANISAAYNGGVQSAALTVVPPPAVTSLTLNPTSVVGGSANSIGTVTLNAPATGSSSARTVTLSSSSTTAATVPSSVTVASGATSATFTVTSHTVLTLASPIITATLNGTATATLTVNPIAVSSVTLNPTSVRGGIANSTGTVTLNAPASGTTAQRTVTLSSDNTAAATIPTSVTVASGAKSATFTVTSHTVTASATANITATYNGTASSGGLTVTP